VSEGLPMLPAGSKAKVSRPRRLWASSRRPMGAGTDMGERGVALLADDVAARPSYSRMSTPRGPGSVTSSTSAPKSFCSSL
jgi:hypothetical protein